MGWKRFLAAMAVVGAAAAAMPAPARAQGTQATSQQWGNFRGPGFDGSAQASGLRAQWSDEEGILWSAKLPGSGSSTPAVWGNRVFLTSTGGPQGGQVRAICLDAADGKVLWSFGLGKNRRVGYGDMTSPSPVTDGQRVVFMAGNGQLVACDFAGQQLWQRDVKQEFGAMAWNFGYGASPLLFGGRLYVQMMRRPSKPQGPAEGFEAFLLAVDPATGKDLWRQPRTGEAVEESWESYMTPAVHPARSGPQLILGGADAITGYDPQTGRELWRCSYNEQRQRNWRLVPTPASDGQRVYVALPRGTELVAIDPEHGRGAGTTPLAERTVWKLNANVPDVCSLLLYQGRLYMLDGDRRVVTCLEPETGRQIWRGELGGNTVIRSSPTAADGKIYFVDERGQVFVLAAGEEFKVLNRIDMGSAQPARSSIAIAGGRLYIRTGEALHCIGPAAAGR